MILFIKGLIIGCAAILPGVSGGTLAMTLGIYEKLIKITSNFFDNFKENIKFLMPIIIGGATGIFLLSNAMNIALEKYEVATILFVLGLLIGGIPALLKKVKKRSINIKNISISIISFIIVVIFMLLKETNNAVSFVNMNMFDYVTLFLIGVLAATTLVVPGISGSLLLMILGYYKPIIEVISSFLKFQNLGKNFMILSSFGLGVLVGIVLMAKIINYFLKKHPTETYYSIYGIIAASILGVLLPIPNGIAVIFMFVGAFIAYRLGD